MVLLLLLIKAPHHPSSSSSSSSNSCNISPLFYMHADAIITFLRFKMAVKTLIFFLFIIINFSINQAKSTPNYELQLLLSIKNSLHLSNWNQSISYCQWKGVSCNSNTTHVTDIHLSGQNLSGDIPQTIFHFPQIQTIDLSNNQLSGEIPADILSSCVSLRQLNLSDNNFTGQVPLDFPNPYLQILDLSNNMFSGNIPEKIGSFSGLMYLDLGGNALMGRIPISLSNVTSLEVLTMASNQLGGEIPRQIGLMKSLKWLYLGHNNFSGEIPSEIGELTSLNHLDLVNNKHTGEIPSSIGNLTDLKHLFLYLNKLTGMIPLSLFELKKLASLDLSDNFLSGEIPEVIIQLQNLEILHLFSNNFSGGIPNGLVHLPSLQVLQLWSNQLSGQVPENLGKQSNLTIVDLSTNNLTGRIPGSLCNSGHLFKLILFSNFLSGEIPKGICQCKSLKRVRLQSNRLSGELIKSELTQLPLVYFLDLSGNNFTGELTGNISKWDMPELQMLSLARNNFYGSLPDSFGSRKIENIDLSGNNLSGEITTSFGDLPALTQLTLSENQLSGNIPKELSLCEKLVNLDLRGNHMTGKIPNWLTNMKVLSRIDLSENEFSGEVPPDLGKMVSLVEVNISYNHLHGRLPLIGVFLAVNATDVSGNHLCGGPAPANLPACKRMKKHVWWLFLTCILSVLVLILIAAMLISIVKRRSRTRTEDMITIKNNILKDQDEGVWDVEFFNNSNDSNSMITLGDISNSIKEENVVSTMVTCATSNAKFSIEIINNSLFSSSSSSFWSDVNETSRFHHPNIAKLMGTSKSKKGSYGFLVYEHVEGRLLRELVLGGMLKWENRRKIALGISRAIHYLHGRRRGAAVAVVVDLSPEKIMVDQKNEARLRLITLPMVINKETREVKEEIYGFGLILIELLTGRTHIPDHESGSINNYGSVVEWARYCYADCHMDAWVDPTIKNEVETNNCEKEIADAMNLALRCTNDDPTVRPCGRELVKAFEYCNIGRPFSWLSSFKKI